MHDEKRVKKEVIVDPLCDECIKEGRKNPGHQMSCCDEACEGRAPMCTSWMCSLGGPPCYGSSANAYCECHEMGFSHLHQPQRVFPPVSVA